MGEEIATQKLIAVFKLCKKANLTTDEHGFANLNMLKLKRQ